MGQDKTLVVILAMHRCGSSITAQLLQRLGMSLGPYDLGEVNESNKYGHFEAQPFVLLNREFQLRHFGFEGDLPDTAEQLNRFCACDGQWQTTDDLTDEAIARGRDLVKELMQSGDVCGFKDPRTVLIWPFWQRVLAKLPGVRVVLLNLVRSPHEVATSIFRRSQGERDYAQALEVAGIHFRCMSRIVNDWCGSAAVVQFEPQTYPAQIRRAIEMCGLNWSDAVLADVYDATCLHCQGARVAHPAQAAFDGLTGASGAEPEIGDLRRLLTDAAAREAILKQRRDAFRRERDAAQRDVAILQSELARASESRNLVEAVSTPILGATAGLPSSEVSEGSHS